MALHFGIPIFASALLCGLSTGQFVSQPPGFGMTTYTGTNGYFNSHSGYLQQLYPPGIQTRFVVVVPKGQRAQISIDVTNPQLFRLRPYDFAVIFDGASAQQLSKPCVFASYLALGQNGIDYRGIAMDDVSSVKTFISKTNVAVVDFCVDSHNFGYDPTMIGFRAFWSSLASAGPGPVATPPPPPAPVPTTAPSSGCGRPLVPPSAAVQLTRIVGGVVAPANSWPWTCALVDGGGQFCGCSVLNAQWVITAGHCVSDVDEATMIRLVTIYYGSQNLLSARKSGISRVISHPQFDVPAGSISHDIAMIKLAAPIPNLPTTSVAPICLPSAPLGSFTPPTPVPAANYGRPLAYVAGWGMLVYQQQSTSAQIGSGTDQLLQATIEMFNRTDCVKSYPNPFPDSSLCGGLPTGGRDSCQGDSGGPLVAQQADGSYGLFGVVSFGDRCADPGKPGAYSDTYFMSPWIHQTMATN